MIDASVLLRAAHLDIAEEECGFGGISVRDFKQNDLVTYGKTDAPEKTAVELRYASGDASYGSV
jgi:hypothetical protein